MEDKKDLGSPRLFVAFEIKGVRTEIDFCRAHGFSEQWILGMMQTILDVFNGENVPMKNVENPSENVEK